MAKATKNPTSRVKFDPRLTRGVLYALGCSPAKDVPDPDGRGELIAAARSCLDSPDHEGCEGALMDLLLAVDVLVDWERAALSRALESDGFRAAFGIVVAPVEIAAAVEKQP